MKRIIEVKREHVYYKGQEVGYLVDVLRKSFGFVSGESYEVVIIKGNQYKFAPDDKGYYDIYKKGLLMGWVCRKLFSKLFFKPNPRNRYDITVKKVK